MKDAIDVCLCVKIAIEMTAEYTTTCVTTETQNQWDFKFCS